MHRKDDTMNSDNLRIFNALKAIADKLGADDKSNVSENEVGKIAEELERIAMIDDLKPEPGGGGGGSLSELSDTEIATPSNNDVLTYDSSANKWKNAAGGGSGGGLVVTASWVDNAYVFNKTWQEIYDAIEGGQFVSVALEGSYISSIEKIGNEMPFGYYCTVNGGNEAFTAETADSYPTWVYEG